jgi:peptide/nickel transport system substrate-binding protein
MNKDAGVLNTSVTEIEARSEYEVAVKFNEFDSALLGSLASHSAQFISKEYYDKNGEEAAAQKMIGTGPFMVESYTPGGDAVLVKNPDYWREGEPYLDGMTFIQTVDEMARTLAMQAEGADGADLLDSMSAEQVATLRDSAPVYAVPFSNGVVSIFPSSAVEGSPFEKLEVRQAVSYAIDRDSLIAARGFGLLTSAYQYIPENFSGHLPESDEVPHYDPAKAKELLAAAGYPDGFKTKLICESGVADRDAVTAMAAQFAEVGIECELEFPDIAGSNVYRMQGGYDGMFVGRLTSFPQIYLCFLRMGMDPTFTNPGYPAMWRPDDEETIAMFEAMRQDQTGDASLAEAYHKRMIENMVAVPIYYTYETFVYKNNVHGGSYGDYGTGTQYLPSQIWKEQ